MSHESSAHQQDEKNTILKDEENLVLDHNYDGIQELDHPLPNWWLWIFYLTTIFGAFYAGYYLSGYGPTLRDELSVAMQEIEAVKSQKPSGDGETTDASLLALVQNPEKVKHGSEVFTGKCAACHGDKGQGLIGPNLTDDFWIHGAGQLTQIAKVISEGVAEKGMPPWGAVLTPDELQDVTAFIRSIHGSQPAGAKEPQGESHPLEAAGAAASSQKGS